jgi:starch synthase
MGWVGGLRCLFVASEVAGFAKTGGLADVAASLPRALSQRGVECAVMLPMSRAARHAATPPQPTGLTFTVPMGKKLVAGTLWRSALSTRQGPPIPVFLVGQPDYYERDDPSQGRGLYQFTKPAGQKIDYADNCERYGFFCRAVLEAIRLLDFWPDVLHLNDWQTGLVPVYLREIYPHQTHGHDRARYAQIKTLLTIHNLAYQGNFWHLDVPLLGLPWRLFNFEQLEFYSHINFLKAGIVFADLLTTVSPTYAREIQTPYFGCGLQGVLLQRTSKLHGIVNGVDYQVWDPKIDPHLAANYDGQTVVEGKRVCKAALQEQFGLDSDPRVALIGMVSRLVDQKGLDLLAQGAGELLKENVQLIVLGEGAATYHQMLARLHRDFPKRVGVTVAQDEALAHRIEAGADMFLMPSQYEPCGLNQLYSLKYGTVPVVRATGGLTDTVTDATPANLAAGRATGFTFVVYSARAFLEAVRRALAMYYGAPEQWLAVQRTGMRQDWSWDRSAAEYERLYRSLLTG